MDAVPKVQPLRFQIKRNFDRYLAVSRACVVACRNGNLGPASELATWIQACPELTYRAIGLGFSAVELKRWLLGNLKLVPTASKSIKAA